MRRKIPYIVECYFIVAIAIVFCIVIQVLIQDFGILDYIKNKTINNVISIILPIALILLADLGLGIIMRKRYKNEKNLNLIIEYASIYFLISSGIGMLLIDLRLSCIALTILLGKYVFFKGLKIKDIGKSIKDYFISLIKVDSFEATLCRNLALISIESFTFVLEYRIVMCRRDMNFIILTVSLVVICISTLFSWDGALLNSWESKLESQKEEIDSWVNQEKLKRKNSISPTM